MNNARIYHIAHNIYMSTAFVHPQNRTLTETVYPAPAKLEDVYKFIDNHDDDQKALRKFLNGKPNTYVFCKALSEAYISENCGDLPTVIIRPSGVTAIKENPLKGWIDNNSQLFPMVMDSICKGWGRVLYGKKNNATDIIPVDYVANLTIVAASRARIKDVQVFNSTTSSENPVDYSQFLDILIKQTVKYNKNTLPFPSVYYCNSKIGVHIFTWIFQVTPAQIADLFLRLRGKKPKYVAIMKKAITARLIGDNFTCKVWDMKAGRTRALYLSLSPEDKKAFPFDPAEIDWSQYIKDYSEWNLKYVKSIFSW